MSKKKIEKDNTNYRTPSILCQCLLIELFIIFGIVSLFNDAFVSVVSIILALIMLVMAYNNHYIFKRKAMTWIYLAFGIFILISELLGIMA